jgi:hypothetical protein
VRILRTAKFLFKIGSDLDRVERGDHPLNRFRFSNRSKGSANKTIAEMKLAKNTHLKKNLQHQAEVYQEASGAGNAIKVIVYFS